MSIGIHETQCVPAARVLRRAPPRASPRSPKTHGCTRSAHRDGRPFLCKAPMKHRACDTNMSLSASDIRKERAAGAPPSASGIRKEHAIVRNGPELGGEMTLS
eukprot:4731585-Prymnesium_polylepis.1